MKTVEYKLNGRTYHLCMNGAAMFDAYDKFGTKGEITEHIRPATQKGFNNTCWLLARLSEQGAAVRKYLGLECEKPLSEAYCRIMLKPIDVLDAKSKIMEAISRGFLREEEEEEFDIGLAELRQKKTAELTEQNIYTQERRFSDSPRRKRCCFVRAASWIWRKLRKSNVE